MRLSEWAVAAGRPAGTMADRRRGTPGVRTLIGLCFGFLLVASCAVFAPSIRASELPIPTGPHPVGVVSVRLAPRSQKDGKADLLVQVWYPGRAGSVGPGASGSVRVSWHSVGFDHRFATAALLGIPIEDGPNRLPLLVHVPGWGGSRTDNSALAQDLASHGFVVVAMDPINVPAIGMDFSSVEANAATLATAERLVRTQAREASDLLDRLATAFRPDGPLPLLANRVDASRAGILGFSFGGAVAAQACWGDDRFVAALNMDGWSFGDAAADGIRQPLMLISDDSTLPSETDLTSADAATRFTSRLNVEDDRRTIANMARHGGVRVTIAGTRHANFSDLPLVWPIRSMTGAGPVAPVEAFRLTSAYVVAFFGEHLQGAKPEFLRPGAVPPPGVRFDLWPVPAQPR